MKRVLLPVALLFVAMAVNAQEDAVKSAKRKMATDPVAAEALIKDALTNPETMSKADTWNTAGKIEKAIFDAEQEKMWLQQPADTVKMYNSLVDMCGYYLKCDEYEQVPNEKGKIKLKYRKTNAATIDQNRLFAIDGGNYFYTIGDDASALRAWGMYVDLASAPMMASYEYAQTDTLLADVAYYATVAGLRAKDYAATIKYSKVASNDPQYAEEVAEYTAQAYLELADTAGWETYVKECIKRFPTNQYLFSQLINYYLTHDKLDVAEQYGQEMLANNPNDGMTLYIVGYIYQLMDNLDKAIDLLTKSTEVDPTNSYAFSTLGSVYIDLAQDASQRVPADINDPNYKKANDEYLSYVNNARTYYEKARELAPDNKELWLRQLYSIYYALNDPKFEEIEKLM